MIAGLAAGIVAIATAAPIAASGQAFEIGRFLSLGSTDAAARWTATHPSDQRLFYILDSATGRIDICGDMTGACSSIAESNRQPSSGANSRFVGLGVVDANKTWKASHPADQHLIYSMDSATGEIQLCGDVSKTCSFLAKRTAAAKNESAKIVIVYRRADAAALAGRIYDRFSAHYGKDAVFLDVYSIPLATDWTDRVKQASLHAQVVVSLIGPKWIGPMPDGTMRIDQQGDPVRVEIETALQARVPVFPVLIEGATMPTTSELPASLKSFAAINAATIHSGPDFDADMARLLAAIDQRLSEGRLALP